MKTQATTSDRTRWGRPRFGNSSGVLLLLSGLLAVLLSGGIGGLFAYFGGNSNPWLAFGIMGIVTLPVSFALAWALLVDRKTIRGATDRPEESIENTWYDHAASGAFTDLIAIIGLGAGGFAIFDLTIDPSTLLIGLFTLAGIDFGARYWLAKRADS